MHLFSYFNKQPIVPNLITTDIHSHLLPGIDDGIKTLKESIEIIRQFKSLGYQKLITTPHIFSDLHPNTIKIIKDKLSIVQKSVMEENIEITIEASAEYYLDMEFLKLIENDELLPFMGNYILFEIPCSSKPIILNIAIKGIIRKGYIPVLAHPERYHYLYDNSLEHYKNLKRRGVLFQVNLKSLESRSKSIKKIALKLIKEELVDFIGSDVHKLSDISRIKKVLQNRKYMNLIKRNNILNNE